MQIQADQFQKTTEKTIERDKTDDPYEYVELNERILNLQELREKILQQRYLEEARFRQENDIKRLEKFKIWVKERIPELAAISISVAGIITTIIVDTRKTVVQAAQTTGKFAKSLYNLGKKLRSLIAPLLNLLAQVVSVLY